METELLKQMRENTVGRAKIESISVHVNKEGESLKNLYTENQARLSE
jgi:hypothetical protein